VNKVTNAALAAGWAAFAKLGCVMEATGCAASMSSP
jgi:hypothetical protein